MAGKAGTNPRFRQRPRALTDYFGLLVPQSGQTSGIRFVTRPPTREMTARSVAVRSPAGLRETGARVRPYCLRNPITEVTDAAQDFPSVRADFCHPRRCRRSVRLADEQ